MINQTFQHCKGIGPITEENIFQAGINSWQDLLNSSEPLPISDRKRDSLMHMTEQSIYALESDDIHFFVDSFSPSEHWRILDRYLNKASYFDIETTGFSSYDSDISCIVCLHKGELHTFVKGENLDDFLELLDDIDLLVSFNGTSFDVPFLVNSFRIPDLPCPHVDLRWVAYHAGLTGGLKHIERQLGLSRPEALHGVDGYEAIFLWHNWTEHRDNASRDKLIRYCQYDVESLEHLCKAVLKRYREKYSDSSRVIM